MLFHQNHRKSKENERSKAADQLIKAHSNIGDLLEFPKEVRHQMARYVIFLNGSFLFSSFYIAI